MEEVLKLQVLHQPRTSSISQWLACSQTTVWDPVPDKCLALVQPGNQSALEEIADIRSKVQQRRENPTPLRALTVSPG